MVDLTEGVVIGGRTFRQSTDMTFEQELYVMSVVTDAGLHNIEAETGTAEDVTESVMHVIAKAYSSGKLLLLLASLLQEEGTEWSIPMVEANANWFAGLKDRESKDQLLQVMTLALLAFFAKGDVAQQISLRSTAESGKTEATSGVPESEQTEAASISENGPE